MFRSPPTVFDDLVAKATDENLTSENWELILAVCDKVEEDSAENSKDAVLALIKRLSHRNANVQLYTLELANALVQNCGRPLHRELASRTFTEKLLSMAKDRDTHSLVRNKIGDLMKDWAKEFGTARDLENMGFAFEELKSQVPSLATTYVPERLPKTAIADRKREEEELKMAIELSIRESQAQSARKTTVPTSRIVQDHPPSSYTPPAQVPQSQVASQTGYPPPTTSTPTPAPPSGDGNKATVSKVKALFDFIPNEAGELKFFRGDIITVVEPVYRSWWKGTLRGNTGIFPLNYVEEIAEPTHEDLQREARMEAEVFDEIPNVEKLLALLSTRPSGAQLSPQENEEISTLYNSTLTIRPKLIDLIEKYSKKKDEFTLLNEKFIKAKQDYESLLETSMSQYGGAGYRPPFQSAYGGGAPQGPYGGPSGPPHGHPGPHGPTHRTGYAASPVGYGPAGQAASPPAAYRVVPGGIPPAQSASPAVAPSSVHHHGPAGSVSSLPYAQPGQGSNGGVNNVPVSIPAYPSSTTPQPGYGYGASASPPSGITEAPAGPGPAMPAASGPSPPPSQLYTAYRPPQVDGAYRPGGAGAEGPKPFSSGEDGGMDKIESFYR